MSSIFSSIQRAATLSYYRRGRFSRKLSHYNFLYIQLLLHTISLATTRSHHRSLPPLPVLLQCCRLLLTLSAIAGRGHCGVLLVVVLNSLVMTGTSFCQDDYDSDLMFGLRDYCVITAPSADLTILSTVKTSGLSRRQRRRCRHVDGSRLEVKLASRISAAAVVLPFSYHHSRYCFSVAACCCCWEGRLWCIVGGGFEFFGDNGDKPFIHDTFCYDDYDNYLRPGMSDYCPFRRSCTNEYRYD